MTLVRRPSWCRVLALAAAVAVALAFAGCGDDGQGAGPGRPDEVPSTADGEVRPTPDLEQVWRWSAEPPGSVGMPAADGDGVSATYGHLRLVLLDLDGRLQWEVERVGLRDVAPALTPDLVVAATEQGVMAVDRGTGTVRWDAPVGERANTPVVAGGLAVASTWEGSLTAFDLDDGRVAWRAALPGPAIGPAASDGTAVAVTWESRVGDAAGAVVVDVGDGRERWSVPLEPGGVGGPAIVELPDDAGAVVVFVAGDIAAHGLDLADGGERWRTATRGRGSPEVPPLPLGDGVVLVAHRLAGLVLLDAATGESRWEAAADRSVAVRGGPVGTRAEGPFAFPLDDGRLLLAGPGREATALHYPGRVSGVATAPDGLLVVATREAPANHLYGVTGL